MHNQNFLNRDHYTQECKSSYSIINWAKWSNLPWRNNWKWDLVLQTSGGDLIRIQLCPSTTSCNQISQSLLRQWNYNITSFENISLKTKSWPIYSQICHIASSIILHQQSLESREIVQSITAGNALETATASADHQCWVWYSRWPFASKRTSGRTTGVEMRRGSEAAIKRQCLCWVTGGNSGPGQHICTEVRNNCT